MRPPYPTDLVPLLPEFLQHRRAKMDLPLRLMEELGLDRPALFEALQLGYIGDEVPEHRRRGHYATIHGQWRAAAAAAEGAGLVEEGPRGWRQTDRGRALAERYHRAVAEHFASLSPLGVTELGLLADLLGRALEASLGALPAEHRDHAPRASRYRAHVPQTSALARLDSAVYGLLQVRDDCHVAAWREASIDGPTLDVLTRVWRKEAATSDELAPKLTAQRPEDVTAALERLRRAGRVAAGEPLATTEAGAAFRQAIEDETDRCFFTPWPEDVGARGGWMRDRLAAVNESLR